MENKNKCISFGKCNKRYWLFMLGIATTKMTLIFLSYLFSEKTEIEMNNIINFMSFLFFENLGQSLMIIPSFLQKKNISSKKDDSSKIKETNITIEKYLFNKISINFSKMDKIYIILFGLLKFFLDIIYSYCINFRATENYKYKYIYIITFQFQFELLFLFLVSKFLYTMEYYKHQYFSIIIILSISLVQFILEYYEKDINEFFFILAFFIIYSSFKSLLICYIKGLIKYKYFSPYKICSIYGIFNLIIVTLVYIIISFFPCENDVFCLVQYNGKKYFGNIILIFSLSGLFMFFLFTIKSVMTVLKYIIIHEFSVCHPYFLNNITEILGIIFFSPENDNIYFKVFTIIGVFGLCNFMILIFLEIIEINICGMSYNTKKNIAARAILDSEYNDIIDDESSYQEDGEDLFSQTELN